MNILIAAAVLALAVIPSALGRSLTCQHGIVQRKEFRQLAPNEVQDLYAALGQLRQRPSPNQLSFWDQLAKTHYEHNSYIHGNPLFLPWHRYFCSYVEQELQRVSGKAIALPYWNWDVDSEAPEQSPVWTADNYGTNGQGDNQCVTDGVWANFQAIVPEDQPHCLQRSWSEGSSIGKLSSVDEIAAIISRFKDYDGFRTNLEGVPHGTVHVNIGGDMGVMYSPNDPVFFLHHAKIDKIWWDWQKVHGFDQLYGGQQTQFMGRNGDRGALHKASLQDKLQPFDEWVVADMFRTEPFCYTYADVNTNQAVPNMPVPTIQPPRQPTQPQQPPPKSGGDSDDDRHPHLSKIKNFFHHIFNAAPQDPSTLPIGVKPKPIVGVTPVDKTVSIRPAVATKPNDRTELLLLRSHKPLPQHWIEVNHLDVKRVREHEKETNDLIVKLNNIPGFISHSALWNRPEVVAKLATKASNIFKATINKAAIAVQVVQQHAANLQVTADIHAKVRLTLGVDAMQDIEGVKAEVLQVIGGDGGFATDSISNPLAPRKIADASTVRK